MGVRERVFSFFSVCVVCGKITVASLKLPHMSMNGDFCAHVLFSPTR